MILQKDRQEDDAFYYKFWKMLKKRSSVIAGTAAFVVVSRCVII